MELYKWCPSCNKEEIVNEENPKTVYVGTDGFGQPVRYSECECGKAYGWFQLGFYRGRTEINESFLSYLKSRITFYHRGE